MLTIDGQNTQIQIPGKGFCIFPEKGEDGRYTNLMIMILISLLSPLISLFSEGESIHDLEGKDTPSTYWVNMVKRMGASQMPISFQRPSLSSKSSSFKGKCQLKKKKLIRFSHDHLLYAMTLQWKQMKGFNWWHILIKIMREFSTQLCRKERTNVDMSYSSDHLLVCDEW